MTENTASHPDSLVSLAAAVPPPAPTRIVDEKTENYLLQTFERNAQQFDSSSKFRFRVDALQRDLRNSLDEYDWSHGEPDAVLAVCVDHARGKQPYHETVRKAIQKLVNDLNFYQKSLVLRVC